MTSRELRHFPLTAEVAIAVLLFLYLPLAVVAWMSFNRGPSALVWEGWSVQGYVEAWSDPTLTRATQNSLILALSSMVLSTALATSAAVAAWSRQETRRSDLRGVVIALPLVIPEVVLAIATVMMFSIFAFEIGFVAVLFAHVVFCVPLAYLPINARLKTIDRTLLEAAADLSAPPWAAFRQITVPLALPGIVAGALLAFVASMNDYVTSYFLAGAGMTTLPMYIFSALKIGITPKVNAISTAVIGLSSIQLLTVWVLGRKGAGQTATPGRSELGHANIQTIGTV
ncbi:ABC transporter permease subunit [Burkholderia pseudomallei]|uniref:Spermidine/putrescine transport system permease protein PotC n=1 Tax=Burkholderia pseudomallei TaxID=28450 RepID=A0A8A4DPB2_BURPE|nr:ABC transporter permease [Burkholderia pseudomallei]KGW44877.1 binding--dependent transport system inner membrane component family protein [Burkholderia pseudomallei MSHR684]KGX77755.1 binding--dependent transport system inner membrane component family protein [Burkholderia pseudomallei MSHR435]AGR68550.1 binding--dependent transport system inner membrane component family protein [Burkholderia pseudomallei MSHR305]AHE37656.1 binding--dependent transport system inner membrane component family